MYPKITRWFQSYRFGPHAATLLAADSAITALAGLAAWLFNYGAASCTANLGTLFRVLPTYMLFYAVGFLLLQTYNSFERQPNANLRNAILAVSISVCILSLLQNYSGLKIFSVFRIHDLLLQAIFTLIGMNILRIFVKAHYDYYGRRGSSNGAYGLSDIALLNMEMTDLLQRNPIEVDTEAIRQEMDGKRIFVTGAAGSIGSELVNLLAGYNPGMLVLIDQAESPLHDVRMMLERDYPSIRYTAIVTDICHSHRMEQLFKKFRPEIIFHAAAYKHVPMMEDNPIESVLNNVDGTRKLANLAVAYEVDKFVMISTDKAVNPTNIMGCSKRICEIYCQSLARNERHGGCQFITTRFGNVLGSNGSVVPIFREQIRRGGPVQVTHPDIIRYFMLIPEACQLVLEAATIGHGGEILAFDMGKPVRIADLARKMIKISHREDIRIEYTGLRPGEKLYEELLNDDETVLPTSHDKIKIATVREYDFDTVKQQIEQLVETARTYDAGETIRLMSELVPEYKPNRK
ncbi:MAG: polysaccharide biosynthesis protein [Coprobacter sp.]|nr:polysaccharide biosynthesis protein [Coprobacter sp.]